MFSWARLGCRRAEEERGGIALQLFPEPAVDVGCVAETPQSAIEARQGALHSDRRCAHLARGEVKAVCAAVESGD